MEQGKNKPCAITSSQYNIIEIFFMCTIFEMNKSRSNNKIECLNSQILLLISFTHNHNYQTMYLLA